MKKKKLELGKLKVQSFITEVDNHKMNTIKAGSGACSDQNVNCGPTGNGGGEGEEDEEKEIGDEKGNGTGGFIVCTALCSFICF